MDALEREYVSGIASEDVRTWLKAEMLKGLQEESLKEVEGPFIFGNNEDGSPAWEICYTANGWPFIRGKVRAWTDTTGSPAPTS